MENPRQKIKSIKNQLNIFILFFYFIKSQTSDSFVSHFDGHFAYLKTLDFSFKKAFSFNINNSYTYRTGLFKKAFSFK